MFPDALGVMAGSQIATRVLYPRLGPRRVAAGGLLLVTVALGAMTLVDSPGQLWWMRSLMFMFGFGMTHAFVSAQAAGFATISAEAMSRATAMFSAFRQVGGALGVAALTTALTLLGATTQDARAHTAVHLDAYHATFGIAAAIALAGAVVARRLDDVAAAATIVRRRKDTAADPVV
jgi:MFS family permease